MPLITVFLTSYNHEEYIGKAIESILNQTDCDFELYIVDDGSSDDSWSVISSYADPRIHATRLKHNTGGAYFFDTIDTFTTPYIAIAHSDDCWQPDKLEKQIAWLDAHPQTQACFTWVQLIGDDGRPFERQDHFYQKVFDQPDRTRIEWLRFFFNRGNALCHSSVMVRSRAYREAHLFGYGLSSVPDFVQWIRLCHYGEIKVLPQRLTCFRIHGKEENDSGDSLPNRNRNFTENYLILDEYVDLENEREFVQIFPEAEAYRVGGELMCDYAYARILLDRTADRARHLYGLQLLYGIFRDEKKRARAARLYGYTNVDFVADKVREDVFAYLPPQRFLNGQIFFDCGDGLSDRDRGACPLVYVQENNSFHLQMDLAALGDGRRLLRLRYDPDTQWMRAFSHLQVRLDGQELTAVPVSASRVGEEDWFLTSFQAFSIELPAGGCTAGQLEISGSTRFLSLWEVSPMLEKLKAARNRCAAAKAENADTQQQLAECENELNEARDELARIHGELTATAAELERYRALLHALKTRPVRTVGKAVGRRIRRALTKK